MKQYLFQLSCLSNLRKFITNSTNTSIVFPLLEISSTMQKKFLRTKKQCIAIGWFVVHVLLFHSLLLKVRFTSNGYSSSFMIFLQLDSLQIKSSWDDLEKH